MPQIDDGSAEAGPGRSLRSVWVTLSADEAHDLLDALQVWAEEATHGDLDPQWHTHIDDDHGNELTIAISPPPR